MTVVDRRSWRIGANRLCARNVAIPAPSFRGRAAALGRPRPHGSDRPCACTVPRPGRALVGAPFLRTAGAAQGRPPWRGRSRGPERTCSGRGAAWPPPSGAPRLRLRRPAAWPFLSFPAWLLASGLACPGGPASASLLPPSLCSIVGRPGPRLRAPGGAGGFSLLPLLVGPRSFPFLRFWSPAPPVARRGFLPPCRAAAAAGAAALSHTVMVLIWQLLQEAAKTGQRYAAPSVPHWFRALPAVAMKI